MPSIHLRAPLLLVLLATTAPAQDVLDTVVAFDAGTEERLGQADSDGTTLVVGAPLDSDLGDESGSVYVYRRSGQEWLFEAKLLAPDGAAGDRFGSVALDGDTLAVGAFWHDGPAPDTGKVYIFERSAGAWQLTQELVASVQAEGDSFGLRLDLAGDLLVVSAPYAPVVGHFSGAVHVFRRVAGVWQEEQRLVGSAPHAQAFLGNSVATDGTTVVAGAHFGDFGGVASGAAHVFRLEGGAWVEQARLSPSDAAHDDQFGISVDVEGDRVVVGAHRGDAAYVFEREAGAWVEAARLEGGDVEAGHYFGQAVALEGARVAVGCPRDTELGVGSGAVYLFEQSSAAWAQTAKLVSPLQGGSAFGSRVELDGSLLAVAAPFADLGAFNAGAVHLVKLDGVEDVVCAATPNSTGAAARSWTTGSLRVTDLDLTVHVSDAPPGTFGLFVHGAQSGALPLGDGVLCISPFGGGLYRDLPVLVVDPAGYAARALDLLDLAGVGAVLPGTSWTFQFVFRDSGPASAGMNLSDAIRLDFLP